MAHSRLQINVIYQDNYNYKTENLLSAGRSPHAEHP